MANAETVIAVLEAVRERTPLVHCITNVVVTNVTANGLLAVGASPAMVENAAESADFARIADGLLINLGTLSRERAEAMPQAAAAAREAGTPWVLDPVAVGALVLRTTLAAELLEHRPAVVRGNASEVLALAGADASGVGSTAPPPQKRPWTRRASWPGTRVGRWRSAVLSTSSPTAPLWSRCTTGCRY